MVYSRRLGRKHSRWLVLWYPVVSIIVLDLVYQILIAWRQSSLISRAQPRYLLLAILNQLAIYVILVPPMQDFFARAKIRLSGRRAFSLLAMGLAFARVIPLGDYLVWRTALRRYRGGVSATTQWYVMYYTWMFSALVILFLSAEAVTYMLHPHAHVRTLVGALKYLPISLSVIVGLGIMATRLRWVRNKVKAVAFDKLGSQSLSPIGIIRDRKLWPNTLGLLSFASMVNWLLEGYTLYLCLRSIGLNIPLSIALFGYAFARLFSLIPILPGGIGQIEAGTALFFASYGYAFSPILTATILYRLISYWPALLIGAASYVSSSKSEHMASLTFPHPAAAGSLHIR
ncbi:MAG TPA: lysylphosphatidylglycerol synthase transmembrane domain-containing protein [Candidatus Saccharimonadia bacterium]|nr:lysylphosphatidylglycerol synthase transmembrane domain-containing protein [Candidatus Saccharimonadia bacterium]